MVDDGLWYHTREVVGGDNQRFSISAKSRTFYTDGLDMGSDRGGVLRRSTTLAEASSASATCAALLTSGITSRGSH